MDGVGVARTAAGITRSVRSYSRSKFTRRAAVTRPAQNRYSSATLPSCQFHICPGSRAGRSTPVCAARMGPRSATSSYTRSTRSGKSRAMRTMRPQASVPARAIRHRRCGCRRIGISEASWPQYSNNSRRYRPGRMRREPVQNLAGIGAQSGE